LGWGDVSRFGVISVDFMYDLARFWLTRRCL
jgi:hypothetical protein